MKKYLISALFIIIHITLCLGIQSDTFSLANSALEEGKIDDAIALYSTLSDNGYGSTVLYYNLGSAYAQKEDWGDARLYLERAKLEDPLSKEIDQNLEFVKDKVGDYYHFPAYPLSGVIKRIHGLFGKDILAITLWISFSITLMMLYRWKIKKMSGRWKVLTYGFLWLSGFLLVLFLFELSYYSFHSKMAIASSSKELYEVPEESSSLIVQLNAGHKVRILEDLGKWKRIDLSDGTEGWLTSEHLEPIVTKQKS